MQQELWPPSSSGSWQSEREEVIANARSSYRGLIPWISYWIWYEDLLRFYEA
jgi:hypothetical protein